jgi:hypothetical protein
LEISYAPGVHAGSDRMTGADPPTVNVIADLTSLRAAFARVNVTS